MDLSIRQSGQATCLLTLRLLHAPYSLMNYAAGATDLPAWTFAWTTLMGMVPTFFMMQMAQETVRRIAGIIQIDNQANVVYGEEHTQ